MTAPRGGTMKQRDGVQRFSDVLVPMSLHLRGGSYFDHGIDWEKMFVLPRRRRGDWPAARDGIIAPASMLGEGDGPRVALSDEDVSILDGVGSALDGGYLYPHRKTRRMRTPGIWGARSAIRTKGLGWQRAKSRAVQAAGAQQARLVRRASAPVRPPRRSHSRRAPRCRHPGRPRQARVPAPSRSAA